ncbi:hypothetical protein FRB90_002474 [Tulasnella sp. 427]|nr:hypothetical protein FRB90_002474 [Tulasnella sp. 427]
MQSSAPNAVARDNDQANAVKVYSDIFSHHGRCIMEQHMLHKLDDKNPIELPLPSTDADTFDSGYTGSKTVGILGGGVGGLYAAMMLESVGVPYEVLEARDRVGGRLFTYKFEDSDTYDYFDVGAMRFPRTDAMNRTFQLFEGKMLNSDGFSLQDKLIPYNFDNDNAFACYNGQPPIRRRDLKLKSSDFEFEEIGVDPTYLVEGADKILWDTLLENFIPPLLQDLKDGGQAGWENLMKFDNYTTRSYLSLVGKLSTEVINWLETVTFGTGWFDQALSEMVLESIAFSSYWGAKRPEFVCIKGGSEVIAETMKAWIDKKNSNAFQLKKRVVGIKAAADNDLINNEEGIYVRVDGEPDARYHHVISTLPLPVLRSLDLEQAKLDIHQYNALRQLQYGPSEKIGVRFKTQWWRTASTINGHKLDIVGGQSTSDRCVRTVVYPSHGKSFSKTQPDSHVLIASYSWTQDALRLGNLISAGDKCKEQVKDLVLRDLAAIHNVRYKFLKDQYIDHFGWDWQHDEYTQGAFAFFGPGNFSTLYKSLTRPAANGHIHFAGEALSVRHAWVVGALDSAWRAVKEVLWVSHRDKLVKFEGLWGNNEEWIVSNWLKSQKDKSLPDAVPEAHVQTDLILCQVMTHVATSL